MLQNYNLCVELIVTLFNIYCCCCCDITMLKMARKPLPVKLQKENPAGYAGEGKQSKGK